MNASRRVLISEGGSGESRAAVAAVRALASRGYEPVVTVSDTLSLAGASRHCAGRVQVPAVESDPEGYASGVRAELAARDYCALLPASDPAILALELPVRHLLDKVACARAAIAAGLSVPPTRVFESVAELRMAASSLDYPVVVKPGVKRFAATRADSPSALASALAALDGDAGQLVVQPFLGDGMHGVVGLVWEGRVVQAMHMRYQRLWPLPCGTVASAETVAADLELEERLATLLAGYDGIFHADLAGPYLLDVNPRIHATLPLALAAGINPVAAYCDLRRGGGAVSAHARAGVFFRWMEGDLRSLTRAVREGRLGARQALRALAPRRGAAHSYESLRDPGPMLERARYAARRIRRGPRPPHGAPAPLSPASAPPEQGYRLPPPA